MPLGKEQAALLFEQTKENLTRLWKCRGPHLFKLIRETSMSRRYRCSLCDGEAWSSERRWYELGLKHGRRRPRNADGGPIP